MKELIFKCWSNDPAERSTIDEVFNFIFINMTIFVFFGIERNIEEDEIELYMLWKRKMLLKSKIKKENSHI